MEHKMKSKYLLGWREWVSLPELGIERIKCKIDTGARTSALHAFYIDPFMVDDIKMIRFGIHPFTKDMTTVLHCEAKVIDERLVTSSDGNRSMRYVISTTMVLGDIKKDIELTLTNRDTMRFRMLLGRKAMDDNCIVDPALSYQKAKPIFYKVNKN